MRKLFVFDWDDNILVMDTKINVNYMGKDVSISTKQFAELRKNGSFQYNADTFINFTDTIKESFLTDVKSALEKSSFAPSWNAFKKCLLNAEEFAIITARGHSVKTIKSTIRYIIRNHFTTAEIEQLLKNAYSKYNVSTIKQYVGLSCAYCVNSPSFLENFSIGKGTDVNETKVIAMRDYLRRMKKRYVGEQLMVGMSDDDTHNVRSMVNYFDTIKGDYHKIVVFDTSTELVEKIVVGQQEKH